MYKIIGADQKEYGPITADQIQQWISEGRVNGQTQACAEDTQDWKPLSQFPEFGFTSGPVAGSTPAANAGAPITAEEILAQDYSLDIGSCMSRGWELFKGNFGLLYGTFKLIALQCAAASGMGQLILAGVGINKLPFATRQYLTPIFIIINSLVTGPALGGLYYVYLSAIRGQPGNAGELFVCFMSCFLDLFLGKLIPSLLVGLCWIPYGIFSASKMGPLMDRLQDHPPAGNAQEIFSQMGSAFGASLPVFLLCMIPVSYFSVNFMFTLALVRDKQIGFWTARKTRWKMVHRHWFHVFGLLVVTGLLNVAGLLVCCVGLLVTIPIGLAAIMYAYEDIFGRKNA